MVNVRLTVWREVVELTSVTLNELDHVAGRQAGSLQGLSGWLSMLDASLPHQHAQHMTASGGRIIIIVHHRIIVVSYLSHCHIDSNTKRINVVSLSHCQIRSSIGFEQERERQRNRKMHDTSHEQNSEAGKQASKAHKQGSRAGRTGGVGHGMAWTAQHTI